jgi:hypothetical protein
VVTGNRKGDKLIKQKLLSAVFTTLLMGVLWFISGFILSVGEPDPFGINEFMFIIIIMAYTAFGTLIFGIPVSFLSDWISNKTSSYRFMIAVFIHLSLAVSTYSVIEELSIFAVLAAMFFFMIEEWKNRKIRTFRMKALARNTFYVLILLVGIWGFYQLDLEEKTNQQYYIPQGFEGVIVIAYKVPGEPSLLKENGKKIIPISNEELVYTNVGDVIKYGEAQTSSEEPGGLINDTYYYVNDEGLRAEIGELCIHRSSGGSFSSDGNEGIDYQALQITNTECGERFSMDGSDLYDEQESIIIDDIISNNY